MFSSARFLVLVSACAMTREAARACCPTAFMYCLMSSIYLINSNNLIGSFNANNKALVYRPFSRHALIISRLSLSRAMYPLLLTPPERMMMLTLSRNSQDIFFLMHNLTNISKSAAMR